jgi:hypothetical protein
VVLELLAHLLFNRGPAEKATKERAQARDQAL